MNRNLVGNSSGRNRRCRRMEIYTIGGFEEVGKNMTAVKVGDDVLIFDAGIYLPPLIELQEQEAR